MFFLGLVIMLQSSEFLGREWACDVLCVGGSPSSGVRSLTYGVVDGRRVPSIKRAVGVSYEITRRCAQVSVHTWAVASGLRAAAGGPQGLRFDLTKRHKGTYLKHASMEGGRSIHSASLYGSGNIAKGRWRLRNVAAFLQSLPMYSYSSNASVWQS